MKKKRLAIIPARDGSKRIKNKNIKLFLGKPIISYTIKNAINSRLFTKIHVSTNSKKIKKIVEKNHKIKIDFLRPNKLSKDTVPLIDVIKFVLEKEKKVYDEIWLLYPCSPLTNKNDLISASKKFSNNKGKFPLMSVREFDAPIEWSLKRKKDIYIPNNKKKISIDSKKLKKNYYESASFLIFKPAHLKLNSNFEKYFGYLLPKRRAIDIDDLDDWNIAESLYKNLMNDTLQ